MRIEAGSYHHTAISTLLIPENCVRMLERALLHASMDELIFKLTSVVVPTQLRPGGLRIRYQQNRLKLVRRDFRVDKAIWFRLGQMARALGVSRCLLFVTLLRAFSEKVSEFRQNFHPTYERLIELFDCRSYRRIAYFKQWLPRWLT